MLAKAQDLALQQRRLMSLEEEFSIITRAFNQPLDAADEADDGAGAPVLATAAWDPSALPLGSPGGAMPAAADTAAGDDRLRNAHMHFAAQQWELRDVPSPGAGTPGQRVLATLSVSGALSSTNDYFMCRRFASAVTAACISVTRSFVPCTVYASPSFYAERAVGAASPLHSLAFVYGGPLGAVVIVPALLVALALQPLSSQCLSSTWSSGAGAGAVAVASPPLDECVLRIANVEGYSLLQHGLHPRCFGALCSAGGGGSLYRGSRTLSRTDARTLPALLGLCGDGCGAVIVCISSAASWDVAIPTGKYVAIVAQDDKRVVYFDASRGLQGPFVVIETSLAETCLFSSPLRVLFRFARADTAALTAARGAFSAGIAAALAPLQPSATAAS